jgi:tetratricopeptide (TPR) repeat protein
MVDSKTLAMLEQYNKGLELYKMRKFEEAIEYFEKALEIIPDDGPSALYIDRCKEFMENPPAEDWDGVYVFTTK